MQGIHSLHQLAPVRVEALQPQPDSRSWHPAHSPVSLQLAPWLKVCGALSRSREGPPTTGATTLTHSSSWSEGAYTCRLTRVAGTQVYSWHFPRNWHSVHEVCRTLSTSRELSPPTTTDVRTPICSSSWHHHQRAYTPALTSAAGTSFTLTHTGLARSSRDRGCKYTERQLRKDLMRKQEGRSVVIRV